MENYRTDLSPTFDKTPYFLPWILEQHYIELLVWHISNNYDICGYVRKLPEQYFNVQLFSNPRDTIQILAEIS